MRSSVSPRRRPRSTGAPGWRARTPIPGPSHRAHGPRPWARTRSHRPPSPRRTGTRGPARCVGRIARDADIEIGGIMIVERMDCGGISSGVVLPARERPGGRAVFGIAAKDLRLVTELFVEVVEMNPGDPAAQ